MHQNGVTVRIGFRHRIGSDGSTGADPVLRHDCGPDLTPDLVHHDTGDDIDAYTFSIAATNRVVAAVATRQHAHTPGLGLTQRLQETQGSGGDTAGIALVDGLVTEVAGKFATAVDIGAVAVELRP